METTANEIVNYKGDSAGALGSPGGAGVNPLYGPTDTQGISEAYRTVATNAFQKNKDEYDRKLKIRDQIYKDLEDDKIQLNKMLPNDRDKVRSEYLDPIRQFLIDKKGDVSDPDDYIHYQELLTDFKEAKKYADARLTFVSGMDSNISSEVDPEKKGRMMQYRNQLYNQGLFDEVKPFQQALDWTKDIFAAPATVESSPTEDVQGDKIVTTKSAQTPLKDFTTQTWFNYTDSPNKSLKNQMDAYKKSFDELPDQQKVDIVKQWNEKIAAANADAGYKQGDLYYVPPIPDPVAEDDGQGGKVLTINATAPEITRAQAILDNYRNVKTREEKVSKLPSEIKENNAQADKAMMEAFYKKKEAEIVLPADAKQKLAQANASNASAAKSSAEAQKIRKEITQDDAVGDFYINQMLQVFDPKKYEGLPSGEQVGMSKTSKLVAYKEKNGQENSALSDLELNSMGMRFNAGKDGISVFKPESVVYNYDNPKNPYFVATYRLPGNAVAGTAEKVETRVWRPNQVLESTIKGIVGENTTGTENKDYKISMRRWKERTGKENINGSVFSEFDKDYWKSNKSMQEEADDAFK